MACCEVISFQFAEHVRRPGADTRGEPVRHFDHLSVDVRQSLFAQPPGAFDKHSSRTVLATALGATLYVPGIRDDLVRVITRRADEGVRSMVVDLEDAVADQHVEQAVENVTKALIDLSDAPQQTMLFVRVRTAEHIRQIIDGAGSRTGALTGFVLPKFSASTGARFLD